MYDLICLGHLTHDKIVTPDHTIHMAGGTSFYFSHAVKSFPIRYQLITSLASEDFSLLDSLRKEGIQFTALPSRQTVYFENIYPDRSDHRIQKVVSEADPFRVEDFLTVESAFFHLGPLLANDISSDIIRVLAQKGKLSLDVQGYLRQVQNQSVIPTDWKEKQEVLSCVDMLKASEQEAETITGETDMLNAAKKLTDWGVKEVVITMGGKGSMVYDGREMYKIPAFKPTVITDATGCGDTYMAGYVYQRIKGADITYAGAFGAAMATIKIAASGPFNETEAAIEKIVKANDVL